MPVLTMELIALTSFILFHGHEGRQSCLGKAQSLVILILCSSFFFSREATGGLFAWFYSFPLQASVNRQENSLPCICVIFIRSEQLLTPLCNIPLKVYSKELL